MLVGLRVCFSMMTLIVILGFFACGEEVPAVIAKLPTVKTAVPKGITATSSATGGKVVDAGGGTISERGICWSLTENPTKENSAIAKAPEGGTGAFEVALTGLDQEGTWHVRAYAINEAGIAYGNEVLFVNKEVSFGSVSDNEGNSYKTVTIGSKTWMAENLRSTKFQDGTPIAGNLSNTEWAQTTQPAYGVYEDNTQYAQTYGLLYNGYVTVDSRNVCPTDWHVPSVGEWNALITALGGMDVAGAKMKEPGLDHWSEPNTGATNSSGFTGLGAGSRLPISGNYADMGSDAYWWSSSTNFTFFYVTNDLLNVRTKANVSRNGMAIRCVKD